MSYNIQFESEKHVFECIVKNPSLIHEINVDWLSVKGQEIYNAIEKLLDDKKNINSDTLFVQTNDDELKEFISNIFNADINLDDFSVYKERLKRDFIKEDISVRLSDDLKILVNKRGDLDIEKLTKLSNVLEKNLDILANDRSIIKSICKVTENYKKELIERSQGKFFSYGDSTIDSLTDGANPGEMTCLFGPTSMGKSAFALNLFNKQVNKRIPTAYFSLEMSEISTMDRLISLRTGVPVSKLKLRDADEFEKSYVLEVTNVELNKINKFEDKMYLIDSPGLTLSEFENTIIKLKKRMGVDYMIACIDLWTMLADVGIDASDIEKAINKTQDIIKRQNIHLIAVVQANREADKKGPPSIELIPSLKIRNLNNIKNSAAIGERCRTVLSVFRSKKIAEQYFPDNPLTEAMDDVFEATVLKCSNGKIGSTAKYIYQPDCFRITPFIEKVEDDYQDQV